jgi:hypothetical protein
MSRLSRFSPEILLASGAIVLLAFGQGRWVTTVGDHGIWYSDLAAMRAGGRLLREIRIAYGPLSMEIVFAACRLFGFSTSTYAAFCFVVGIADLFLVLRMAGRFLGTPARLAVSGLLVFFLLWIPPGPSIIYPYAPAVSIGILFAATALLFSTSRGAGPAHFAAAGAAAGLAFLAKQDAGLAAWAGVAAAAFAGKQAGRFSRAFAGTAAAVAVTGGGLAIAFRGLPFRETALHNRMWPFAPVDPSWIAQYAAAAGYDEPGRYTVAVFRQAGALAALAFASAALWHVARGRRKGAARPAALAAAGVLVWLVPVGAGGSILSVASLCAAAALAHAFLRPTSTPVPLAATAVAGGLLSLRVGPRGWIGNPFGSIGAALAAPLIAWAVFEIASGAIRDPSLDEEAGFEWYLSATVTVLVLLAASAGLARVRGFPEPAAPVETHGGRVWLSPAWKTAFERIAPIVERETAPGGAVAFLPRSEGFDFLLARRPATAAPNLVPGILDSALEREIIESFSRDPPAIAVVFEAQFLVDGAEGFGRSYGRALKSFLERSGAPIAESRTGIPFRAWKLR